MKGIRVAKTSDGRFVAETHPDAAVLVYNQHDDVPDEVVSQMTDPVGGEKEQAKPQDKRRRRTRTKAEESPKSASLESGDDEVQE